MSVNKVILVGRLGGDPEVRYTANQQPICSFGLATSERYKDKEGNMKRKLNGIILVCLDGLQRLVTNI